MRHEARLNGRRPPLVIGAAVLRAVASRSRTRSTAIRRRAATAPVPLRGGDWPEVRRRSGAGGATLPMGEQLMAGRRWLLMVSLLLGKRMWMLTAVRHGRRNGSWRRCRPARVLLHCSQIGVLQLVVMVYVGPGVGDVLVPVRTLLLGQQQLLEGGRMSGRPRPHQLGGRLLGDGQRTGVHIVDGIGARVLAVDRDQLDGRVGWRLWLGCGGLVFGWMLMNDRGRGWLIFAVVPWSWHISLLADNRLDDVGWRRRRLHPGGSVECGGKIGLRVIAGVACHRIGQIDQHQEGDGERQAAEDDGVHVQIGRHLVEGGEDDAAHCEEAQHADGEEDFLDQRRPGLGIDEPAASGGYATVFTQTSVLYFFN